MRETRLSMTVRDVGQRDRGCACDGEMTTSRLVDGEQLRGRRRATAWEKARNGMEKLSNDSVTFFSEMQIWGLNLGIKVIKDIVAILP